MPLEVKRIHIIIVAVWHLALNQIACIVCDGIVCVRCDPFRCSKQIKRNENAFSMVYAGNSRGCFPETRAVDGKQRPKPYPMNNFNGVKPGTVSNVDEYVSYAFDERPYTKATPQNARDGDVSDDTHGRSPCSSNDRRREKNT